MARLMGQYLTLTEEEGERLSSIDDKAYRITRNTEIVRPGKASDNLYVVQSGWLLSYVIMPDGRRQVMQIHFPGDIIGFSDLPYPTFACDLKTLSDCSVSVLTLEELQENFLTSERMTGVLLSMVMVDQALHFDRMRVLGRMNARERVIHFLLATMERLRLTGHVYGNAFDFPMTQFDLADAVGLTNVSVSNALSMLQEKKILKKSTGRVEILNEQYMRETSCFVNRYKSVDIGWYIRKASQGS